MTIRSTQLLTIALLCWCPVVSAQQPIANIPLDSIPAGTTVVSGPAAPIGLLADTDIAGRLDASGEVGTGTGIRFPDGTLQVTAANTATGLTANQGLYSNRIPLFSPPNAYTEICFKSGAVMFDIHAIGETTTGGFCEPGDTGWVIERFERASGAGQSWTAARAECLLDGMRLPEPFEWQFSCDDAALFALDSMTDDDEWASNSTQLDTTPGLGYVAAIIFGGGSCSDGSRGAVGRSDAVRGEFTARCVL